MNATWPKETIPVLPTKVWKPITMIALIPKIRTISVIVESRYTTPASAVTTPRDRVG